MIRLCERLDAGLDGVSDIQIAAIQFAWRPYHNRNCPDETMGAISGRDEALSDERAVGAGRQPIIQQEGPPMDTAARSVWDDLAGQVLVLDLSSPYLMIGTLDRCHGD